MVFADERELQDAVIASALPALESFGFALAGGQVLRFHEVLDRLSEDVDLFTSTLSTDNFTNACTAAVDALETAGFTVRTEPLRGDLFARYWVERDGHGTKLELGYDWRSMQPTQLAVGPVLAKEDSAASKVLALWGRGAAKDAMDVAAYLAIFSRQQLIDLASEHDEGFTAESLRTSLEVAANLSDAEYAEYGATTAHAARVRQEMGSWSSALLEPAPPAQLPSPAPWRDPLAPNFGPGTAPRSETSHDPKFRPMST